MHKFYIDRSGNYTYYCINYLGNEISACDFWTSQWRANNFHITIPEELEGGDVPLVLEEWTELKSGINDQIFNSTLNQIFVEKFYNIMPGAKENINLIAMDPGSLIKDYHDKMVFELVDFGNIDFDGFTINLDHKFNAAKKEIYKIESNCNYALDETYSELCLKKEDGKIIINIPNKLYNTSVGIRTLYSLNEIIMGYAAILTHYCKKQVFMCPKCNNPIKKDTDRFVINSSMSVTIGRMNMGNQIFKCPSCEQFLTPTETILMDEPIVRVCRYINDKFSDLKTIYSCCGHNIMEFNAYINLQKDPNSTNDYLNTLQNIISEDTIFSNMFEAREPRGIGNNRIAIYFIHDYIYELLKDKHSFTNVVEYIMDQYIRLFDKLFETPTIKVLFRDPNQ